MIRVRNNDYSAKVLVAKEKNGKLKLYDILGFVPTEIKEKRETQAALTTYPSPDTGRKTASLSHTGNVAHSGDAVKGTTSAESTNEELATLRARNAEASPTQEVPETQKNTASEGETGTAAIRADTSLFDRSILKDTNKARTNLINFARNFFPKSVTNVETGREIGIPRNGLDKFLSGNIGYEKYATGFHIPELIENAYRVGKANNYHPDQSASIPTYEYFDSPINVDGTDYLAHIRVKNSSMGDKYYGHTISEIDGIEIEPSARISPESNSEGQPVNAFDGSTTGTTSEVTAGEPTDTRTPEASEPVPKTTIPQSGDSGQEEKTGSISIMRRGGSSTPIFDSEDERSRFLHEQSAKNGVRGGGKKSRQEKQNKGHIRQRKHSAMAPVKIG